MTPTTLDIRRTSLDRLLGIARCPGCRSGTLAPDAPEALRCELCGQRFPMVDGIPCLFEATSLGEFLPAATAPRPPGRPASRRRRGASGGAYHWREYGIRSLLPDATTARDILLVGCGDGGERPFLHELGFETIAFDIRPTPGTDFLADAHRLPLASATFDVVLSMQVLEHLHSPWIAVEEVARVLRPGGWFIGSVAFLKPYHRSYFHMTHLGVRHLLRLAGLVPDRFEGAQSLTYALYGGMIPLGGRPLRRAVLGGIDRLISRARTAVWSLSRRADPNAPSDRFDDEFLLSFRTFDKLRYAPAVVFRARKPPEPPPEI